VLGLERYVSTGDTAFTNSCLIPYFSPSDPAVHGISMCVNPSVTLSLPGRLLSQRGDIVWNIPCDLGVDLFSIKSSKAGLCGEL
jgi:hypothetical protein